MIPKIIHLCWLSGEPFPTQIQQCIETWHKHLPDYEIIVWDKEKFNINSTLWTKQAYENKKYAFAADYIRLYALYKYGGIYLDSDVLVYKSFNDLLDLPYFIGLDYTESFEAAIIGAEKGTPWIGELLKRYENRSFVKSEKILDTIPLPTIFFHELKNKYKFYLLQNKISYSYNNDIFYIFHQDFFNSRDSMGVRKTKRSYCAHNYAGSWVSNNLSKKKKIQKIMPKWLLRLYFFITHKTISKKKIHKNSPTFMNK